MAAFYASPRKSDARTTCGPKDDGNGQQKKTGAVRKWRVKPLPDSTTTIPDHEYGADPNCLCCNPTYRYDKEGPPWPYDPDAAQCPQCTDLVMSHFTHRPPTTRNPSQLIRDENGHLVKDPWTSTSNEPEPTIALPFRMHATDAILRQVTEISTTHYFGYSRAQF